MFARPAFLALFALALAACAGASSQKLAATEQKLAAYEANDRLVAQHLATFDDLDFNAFSNQRWADFHKSHADDIEVFWPDGHSTKGFDVHIKDLEAMFVYAPDTRIEEHLLSAPGMWTSRG